jgi:hypothetical protein
LPYLCWDIHFLINDSFSLICCLIGLRSYPLCFRTKECVVIVRKTLNFEFRSLIFQKPVVTIFATCCNIKKIFILPVYNVDGSYRFHRTNSNLYQNLPYTVDFMMEAQFYLWASFANGRTQALQYTIWFSRKETSVLFLHIECKCFEKYQINSDYLTSCLYSNHGLCEVEIEIDYKCICRWKVYCQQILWYGDETSKSVWTLKNTLFCTIYIVCLLRVLVTLVAILREVHYNGYITKKHF